VRVYLSQRAWYEKEVNMWEKMNQENWNEEMKMEKMEMNNDMEVNMDETLEMSIKNAGLLITTSSKTDEDDNYTARVLRQDYDTTTEVNVSSDDNVKEMLSQTKPETFRLGRKRNVKNAPENNVKSYPIDIIPNLHANFSEITNIEGLKELEENLGFIELFEGYKFLVSPPRFFGMVSPFYAVFKLSHLPAVVELFNPEDKVIVTRDFVRINNEKLSYINSYSGHFKEFIIYKPLLLAFGGKKHFIRSQNVRKFSEVISKIDQTINVNEVINSPVTKEDVEYLLQNFSSRALKKALNFLGKENELNEEVVLAHITTTGDLINLINKILENNEDNILILRSYVNFAKKFTTQLLSNKENVAIF